MFGLKKVTLPPLVFWQLAVGQASLVALGVHRDSVAHEGEIGVVKGSLSRVERDGYT